MRLRRPFGALVAASMVGDPDVMAYAASVVANGGTVSTARYPTLMAFVGAEKASGAWDLTDDYWGFWAEGSVQALTSLKQRRLAVATNTPTFTTDRNYAFDGVTNYIDTGFIPSSHGLSMTTDNVRLAVYERTNVSGNTVAAGTTSGTSSQALQLRPRNSSNAIGTPNVNLSGGTFTLPAANSQGFTSAARNAAAAGNCVAYKNGAAMTRTVDPTAFGATLPAFSLYVGADNRSGSPLSFRACSVGMVAIGATLSASQELSQYNAVQTWATNVGANV